MADPDITIQASLYRFLMCGTCGGRQFELHAPLADSTGNFEVVCAKCNRVMEDVSWGSEATGNA